MNNECFYEKTREYETTFRPSLVLRVLLPRVLRQPSTPPPPPSAFKSSPSLPLTPSPWVRQVTVTYRIWNGHFSFCAGLTYWSAELSRKDYSRYKGVKVCIFVPVCYNSFNASFTHKYVIIMIHKEIFLTFLR